MKARIKQYDVVTFVDGLLAHRLVQGQVGTIVEQYAPDAFGVEFADREGRTYALETLSAEQLLVLHYEPAYAPRYTDRAGGRKAPGFFVCYISCYNELCLHLINTMMLSEMR